MNLRDRRWRLLVLVPILAGAAALVVFRGPDWHAVRNAFALVRWEWVAAAIGLNLLSVVLRAFAWETTIKQSIAKPHPRFPLVFAAFSVGLFANVVLPGRVGELARVAVLRRRLTGRKGTTATLIGSVFAHRMFDLFPAISLVVWVLFTAKLPGWALYSVALVLGLGVVLFVTAIVLAQRAHRDVFQGLGPVRSLLVRGRQGLAVMRNPVAAATAAAFQFGGWTCQLFAVWATLRAFNIHQPLATAGLVLALINVATIVTLWPGNFGFVQAAIATPLLSYGVDYAHGVAFGIGLQAIEASVGIGVGVIFLMREGFSYAMLKEEIEQEESTIVGDPPEPERSRARAGVPG